MVRGAASGRNIKYSKRQHNLIQRTFGNIFLDTAKHIGGNQCLECFHLLPIRHVAEIVLKRCKVRELERLNEV